MRFHYSRACRSPYEQYGKAGWAGDILAEQWNVDDTTRLDKRLLLIGNIYSADKLSELPSLPRMAGDAEFAKGQDSSQETMMPNLVERWF
jgi:hypothetical protein